MHLGDLMAKREGFARPVAVLIVVMVLVVAVLGLNFVGIINIPFLPQSAEITLARALNDVAHDGEFDLDADANTDAELNIAVDKLELVSDIDLAVTATGSVQNFDSDNLSKLKIADGTFSADVNLAFDIGGLKGETGNVQAAGTYDLTVEKSSLDYALTKPFSYKGTISFDSSSPPQKNGQGGSGGKSIGLKDIKDMKKDGDTITFSVNTDSLSFDDVTELLAMWLESLGLTVENTQMDVSDLDVSVDLSDTTTVRANVTGQMTLAASGKTGEDFLFGLAGSLDTDLSLNVPINVNIALS